MGACLKHFAANNQEKYRNWADSTVDQRALREIYLRAFEIPIRQARPWAVMTAYNRLNGVYCSEHRWLMEQVARDEWGFDGLFVTDWGAMSDPEASFRGGLDLEMPGVCKGTDKELLRAVRDGRLSKADIDRAAGNVLALLAKYQRRDEVPYTCNMDEHSNLAGEISCQSAVLLKNDGALPLRPGASLAVIGVMAKEPRYQGAGSSRICPTRLDSFCQALEEAGVAFDYAPGYRPDSLEPDEDLIKRACAAAKGKDAVLVFAGLPDIAESEGYDREHMDLPAAHNALIRALAAAHPHVVVVLQGGSPMALPWVEQVSGVLLMYLSGQQGGHAAWDLLSGRRNPEGKLAETWPAAAEDEPNRSTFAAEQERVQYRESIYVGYRYFDTAGKAVAYPFGYGLSYTSFSYSDMEIEGRSVSCTVRNTGGVPGGEAVQLYVSLPGSRVFRAEKELKDFQKLHLAPGESARVVFTLPDEALAWFDPRIGQWSVEPGTYLVRIGSSSRDIRLEGELTVTEGRVPEPLAYPVGTAGREEFEALLGHAVPADTPLLPFTKDSLLAHTRCTLLGRLVVSVSARIAAKQIGTGPQAEKMARKTMESMPLRGLGMGGGSRDMIYGIVDIFNGHLFRGLKKIVARKP